MGDNRSKDERIQKLLAQAGVGSRREIERWIADGRISVNGEVASLGAKIVPSDSVAVDGKIISLSSRYEQDYRVIVYSKPEGVICSRSDPEGRPTIFENLPKLKNQRWISVGRLDINTSGLLIITTDGELANRLMHPSSAIDREYAVRILGDVSAENIAQLKQGVELEDGKAHFDDIQFNGGEGANSWYHVTVKEGRNRLVRRLWEALEFQVSRLMRVRYGPIFLPDGLSVRQNHELTATELDDLLTFVGLPTERFAPNVKPGVQTKPKSSFKPGNRQSKRPEERNRVDKKSSFDKNKRPRR